MRVVFSDPGTFLGNVSTDPRSRPPDPLEPCKLRDSSGPSARGSRLEEACLAFVGFLRVSAIALLGFVDRGSEGFHNKGIIGCNTGVLGCENTGYVYIYIYIYIYVCMYVCIKILIGPK